MCNLEIERKYQQCISLKEGSFANVVCARLNSNLGIIFSLIAKKLESFWTFCFLCLDLADVPTVGSRVTASR